MNNAKAFDVVKLLQEVLGSDAVSREASSAIYSDHSSHSLSESSTVCVARPHNVAEISSVLSLANREGLNLIPVSSAIPHRKGGSAPEEEAVILDLSEMDRVIRIDRRNRVAILEPGVKYAKLKEAASNSGMRVLMPFLPRPGKSVIGSYLDREPTTIPKYHWDATDPLLCTEILFGSGDVFRTGSAAGPGSLEEQWEKGSAQKNPMGPAATDLVKIVQGSQGTIGIVTWASVKLEVLPAIHKFHFVQGNSLEKLTSFIYEVLRKKLCDELLALNPTSLAAAVCEEESDAGRLEALQAPYTIIFAVSGTKGFLPEKKVAYQENEISSIAGRNGLIVVDEVPGLDADGIAKILDGPCSGTYWKNRLKGACRDIFFITTLDRVFRLEVIMKEKLAAHDLPLENFGVYIQPIQQGRTCHVEFNLFYDPSNAGESLRIMELARETCPALANSGAFFSRPYDPWVDLAYERCPDSAEALRILKELFDPNNIMNRGKLCFKEVRTK